jgi:molybdopterin converting factor small subunit
MLIKVKLFATLRKYMPDATLGTTVEFEVPEGSSLLDLFALLNIPAEEVKLTYVNGIYCAPETILNNADEVGIFPPVGGG